jgi:hypothetical protein
MGVSFFGTAFSEPTLIKLASGFEAATHVRAHNLPTFAATVPFDHISGTTLMPPNQRDARPADSHRQPPTQPATRVPGKEVRKPHHL